MSIENGRAELIDIPERGGVRGKLWSISFGEQLPFVTARAFVIGGCPLGEVRGEHGHRVCHQFLVSLTGAVQVRTRDRYGNDADFILDSPDRGLLIPAGIWASQEYLDNKAILMVLASELYDPADYFKDFSELL